MDRDFRARLLDGFSAVPQEGRVRLEGTELRFFADDGLERGWPVTGVRSVQRVASEVHLVLPGLDVRAPEQRLEVLDRAFEDVIDGAQRHLGGSAFVGAQRAGRRIGLVGWVLIALVAVPSAYFAYAVAFPRLHVLVSYEKEAALGELVYDKVSSRWVPMEDPEFERVIGRMVEELREPGTPFDLRVSLVDVDELNAFALPGGRIFVFRGLLAAAPSADALAGVLAHEIGHVEERHGLKHTMRSIGLLQFAAGAVGGGIDGLEMAETIVELSSGLLILEHSRDHEREADRIAVSKLRRAGRNARGLVEFFEVVRDEGGDLPASMGWISTHPISSERIEGIEGLAAGQSGQRPWMPPGEWATFQARYTD